MVNRTKKWLVVYIKEVGVLNEIIGEILGAVCSGSTIHIPEAL